MRVLMIEDSERLRTYVGRALRRAGYAVDAAADGVEGLYLAESNEYDVIVLDLMLPKMDGMAVLERLRTHGAQTHVLVLTAKDTVEDRVAGLNLGADDYLVKPFALEELLARVTALARRNHGVKSSAITVGDLIIDTARRRVTRDGADIELRPREFALLEYLAMRKGQVVSRTDIEQHIYDERVELTSNVVDAAMSRLRRAIDRAGTLSFIETRRGMGYVMRDSQP